MAYVTGTMEKALRAELAAYIATIGELAGNIFDRRRQFNSRKDFTDRTSMLVGADTDTAKREIRFMELTLINVEDSIDEDSDECRACKLTYNIHYFHEFIDTRPDGSNSDEDFSTLALLLRQRFLERKDFAGGQAQQDGLTSEAEPIQFGNDSFTDLRGHYHDQTLEIIYYDDDGQG